jgi:hypothetical protein
MQLGLTGRIDIVKYAILQAGWTIPRFNQALTQVQRFRRFRRFRRTRLNSSKLLNLNPLNLTKGSSYPFSYSR